MIHRSTASRLGSLLTLLFAATVPVAATSYVPMADEDLLDQSAVVLMGRVLSVEAGPVSGPPSTDYTVQVSSVFKGESPGARVTVRVLGGIRADGRGLRIYGAPRFANDETVLLFLNPKENRSMRILQYNLGAFHVVDLGDRRLALRNLAGAIQLPAMSDRQRAAAATFQQPRDAERFGRWIVDRTVGFVREPDYMVSLDPGERLQLAEKFTRLRSSGDNLPTRWFLFDDGGLVRWYIDPDGIPNLPGGGRNELRRALDIWENDPSTGIDFTFAGNNGASLGLTEFDDLNVLLFDDPNDEVEGTFSCIGGGTLGVGGPWFTEETFLYKGERYHLIGGGDMVINDGIECAAHFQTGVTEYFEELFAHELGHTLGLGHSCGDDKSPDCSTSSVLDDALMRAQFHGLGRGGHLNADDRAGLRHLYEGTGGAAGGTAAPSDLSAMVEGNAVRLAWSDNSASENGFEIERGVDGTGFARIAQVAADVTTFLDAGVEVGVTHSYRVRATSSKGPSAYSAPASATLLSSAGCEASGVFLCALDGRFRLDMSWVTDQGQVGPGHVVPVDADSSGLFWFFDPANWEVLVKLVDGCGPFDHFWVFAAATTNVGYTLRVIDTENGSTRLYVNPVNVQSAAITDTNAFATCP